MAKVLMYKKAVCPYCVRAIAYLKNLGVENIEFVDIEQNPERRPEMLEKSGGRQTVPQIFINDVHIGGFDDLSSSANQEKVKTLLES